MTTATATRSRVRYVVTCEGFWIGYASDRDEADDIIYGHANRNGRQITQGYQVDVELREQED